MWIWMHCRVYVDLVIEKWEKDISTRDQVQIWRLILTRGHVSHITDKDIGNYKIASYKAAENVAWTVCSKMSP
jgi:hypothetical protein